MQAKIIQIILHLGLINKTLIKIRKFATNLFST